ncbi:hypothetical protein [Argonema antarcticum]|uniref:hypothetical protein n=1 Tax=Argonema antarcticum TaxID=2942763 RepID=UPI0020135FDC|nr:hypothetical protein [Argonema antarcticum]MCL1469871.1 hypothetical protein [Argonema antarcticum A004/B2]
MARLPSETRETIRNQLEQLMEIVEDASEAEFILFERFGEIDSTIENLTDLKTVGEEAAARYFRLSNIRLRIGQAQPAASADMLRLLERAITETELRIPAWKRSIQEIKMEWNLP